MAHQFNSDPLHQKSCTLFQELNANAAKGGLSCCSRLQAEQEAEVQRHVCHGGMLQEELIQRTREAGSLSQQLQMAQALHRDQAAVVQVTHAAGSCEVQQATLKAGVLG